VQRELETERKKPERIEGQVGNKDERKLQRNQNCSERKPIVE